MIVCGLLGGWWATEGRSAGGGWACQGRLRGVLWGLIGSRRGGRGALLGGPRGCHHPFFSKKLLKLFSFCRPLATLSAIASGVAASRAAAARKGVQGRAPVGVTPGSQCERPINIRDMQFFSCNVKARMSLRASGGLADTRSPAGAGSLLQTYRISGRCPSKASRRRRPRATPRHSWRRRSSAFRPWSSS